MYDVNDDWYNRFLPLGIFIVNVLMAISIFLMIRLELEFYLLFMFILTLIVGLFITYNGIRIMCINVKKGE